MVMIMRPMNGKVRYDLGDMLFGTFESLEDTFEFLHALARPENQFVIQLPLPGTADAPYDLEAILAAGRIQQYLYSEGASHRILYEDSPFQER